MTTEKTLMIRKIRIAVLAFMMLMQCSLMAFAQEETSSRDIPAPEAAAEEIRDVYVNPVYRDIISEQDILESAETLPGASAEATEDASVDTLDEAAAYVREQMQLRNTSINVTVNKSISSGEVKAASKEIFTKAVVHTGNPTAGDYLQYQYGGYSVGMSMGSSYTAFRYSVTYYTTAAQEEEMDAAVNEILDAVHADTLNTDYEKITAVYDWITSNVVYDYTNLNDDSYKLKYTAYAAAINKTAVCQGYSVLLYRLALELGVDARVISGIGNGGRHAWNIIGIDGLYYNADSTWDTNYEPGNYQYYLRCNDNFFDHTRNADFTTDEFNNQYPMDEKDYQVPLILNYTKYYLKPGKTVQLTASENVAEWNSSDESIAAVNQSGLVTAVNYGTAVITAASENGLTAECIITVSDQLLLEGIEFRHSASFGNDLSINYYVPVNELTGYDIISLDVRKQVFEDDGSVSWETTELKNFSQTSVSGVKYYRFAYTGIAPKEIGSEVRALLKCEKGGESYVTEEESYNVGTYAYNRLEASTDNTFKTLIVDMLNYGALAQEYFTYNTANPVNAALTEEQKALGTQTDPELKSVEKVTETAGATATFYGKSAVFNSNVELKYYMQFAETQSLNNVKLVLSYTAIDGTAYTEEIKAGDFGYDTSKKAYTAKLISIAAKDVGCTVTAKIYDGNTLISNTLEYSLETYAYNRLNKSTDEVFKSFLRAFMKYGFSAKAYFEKNQ